MAAKTRQLTTLLGTLALAGCASSAGTMRAGDVVDRPVDNGPVSASPSPEAAGGASVEPWSHHRQPGAVALQAQANQQQAAGDYAQAAATLERALRIDAVDPELWLALAEVRLALGEATQAADLAGRSASLAPRDTPVHQRAVELQRQAAAAPGRGR